MLAEDVGPAILELLYFGAGIFFVVIALIGIWPAASGHRLAGFLCVIPAFAWGVFQTVRLFVYWINYESDSDLRDFLMPWLFQGAPSLLVSIVIVIVISLETKKRE